MDVYSSISNLVKESYKLSCLFPRSEQFGMIHQLRKAVLSIKLNFAEGATRRSVAERKRFIEVSRGSLVEVDAIFETAIDLGYLKDSDIVHSDQLINRSFAMLSNLLK